MLQKIMLLALAGALGTVARFGLAGIIQRIYGDSLPWGTLVVNLTGCFIAGLLWSLFEYRWSGAADVRMLVLIGFLGAFTTFSTLMIETGDLARSATWLHAAANLMIHNSLGFVALIAGSVLGSAGLKG
jgi:CrcB protein